MVVEKAAMEQKMKAAVASIMYPAYRMTGMQRRMLASSQQKNAVLEGGKQREEQRFYFLLRFLL